MNLRNSLKLEQIAKLLNESRKQAKHGDFFFAKWTTCDDYVRESPCLVISDHEDPHDEILILKCTTASTNSPQTEKAKSPSSSAARSV
jgi:hypothetical protein